MTKITNSRPTYDLEERTFQFAKLVRLFNKALPKSIANYEGSKNSRFREAVGMFRSL